MKFLKLSFLISFCFLLIKNGNTQNIGISNESNGDIKISDGSTEFLKIQQADGNIGIDVNTPQSKLDINGDVKISGGNPSAGKY